MELGAMANTFIKSMVSGRLIRDLLYWIGSWGLIAGLLQQTRPLGAIIQLVEWLGVPRRRIPDIEGWMDERSSVVFFAALTLFVIGAIASTHEGASRDKVVFVEVWALFFILQSSHAVWLLLPAILVALRIACSWAQAKWGGASYYGLYRGIFTITAAAVDIAMAPVRLLYCEKIDHVNQVKIKGPITISEPVVEERVGPADVST